MKYRSKVLILCICTLLLWSAVGNVHSATVPMTLDHNRMLVSAQIQRKDGTWRTAVLWVDTGNPDLMISSDLARDLGLDLSAEKTPEGTPARSIEVPPLDSVRIGDIRLDLKGIKARVFFEPKWMFAIMHCDANLPSTALRNLQVVFDYPKKEMTLAQPGTLPHQGTKVPAAINTTTGIIQIDATIAGESHSLALDNGAAYSFISIDVFQKLADQHTTWPHNIGAVGCANMWGWWPQEPLWPVMRIPELNWGTVKIENVGVVGLPNFYANGASLGQWYSKKTAKPVDGFLGPNAFRAFRIEIDYANSAVYFEKGSEFDTNDMDVVGVTLQPQSDGTWEIIGIPDVNGKLAVEGIQPGDKLIQIDSLKTNGATMGTVIDALRGKPGDIRNLTVEHEGKPVTVRATVQRFL